jgi:hypothetical protein
LRQLGSLAHRRLKLLQPVVFGEKFFVGDGVITGISQPSEINRVEGLCGLSNLY